MQRARERCLIGLAAAAHEIITPLSTMSVLVQELRRSRTPPADWHAIVEVLWSELEACRRTLAELAKAADAEAQGEPRSIPAKRFVLELVSRFHSLRPEVTLELCWMHIDDACQIHDDPTLSQAVLNFLNNAAEASPQSVGLRAMQKGGHLVLKVLDRGAGIAPQVRSRLGKGPVSTKAPGRGVGLLIAHAAIERYGTSIHLFDRPRGGTCVRIELPMFCSKTENARDRHELLIAAG